MKKVHAWVADNCRKHNNTPPKHTSNRSCECVHCISRSMVQWSESELDRIMSLNRNIKRRDVVTENGYGVQQAFEYALPKTQKKWLAHAAKLDKKSIGVLRNVAGYDATGDSAAHRQPESSHAELDAKERRHQQNIEKKKRQQQRREAPAQVEVVAVAEQQQQQQVDHAAHLAERVAALAVANVIAQARERDAQNVQEQAKQLAELRKLNQEKVRMVERARRERALLKEPVAVEKPAPSAAKSAKQPPNRIGKQPQKPKDIASDTKHIAVERKAVTIVKEPPQAAPKSVPRHLAAKRIQAAFRRLAAVNLLTHLKSKQHEKKKADKAKTKKIRAVLVRMSARRIQRVYRVYHVLQESVREEKRARDAEVARQLEEDEELARALQKLEQQQQPPRQQPPPPPPPAPAAEVEICKEVDQDPMYRTARCRYGDRCRVVDCKYAHSNSELRPLPAHLADGRLEKTAMCKFGDRCTNFSCKFAHHASELRNRPEALKPERAEFDRSKIDCRRGIHCCFVGCAFKHPDGFEPPKKPVVSAPPTESKAPAPPSKSLGKAPAPPALAPPSKIAGKAPASDSDEQNVCSVCFVNSRDSLALQCKHLAVCSTCAASLSECVLCRAPTTWLTIFV